MIEILTVFLGFLMLIATAVYVYYTRQLLNESIKMREVGTYPFINFKLIAKEGFSRVIIENIGKSPAYNLDIEFEENMLKEIKSNCYKTYKSSISYFGVGQYLDIPIHTQKFLDLNKNIVIKVIYKAVDGKKFEDSVELSFEAAKDFGIHYPKSPYADDFNNLTKELENIGKYIQKLTNKNKIDNTLSAEDIDRIARSMSEKKE